MNQFIQDKQGWTKLYARTGVFSLNHVQNIWDEIDYGNNVIDLAFEEVEKQFYSEIREKYNSEHPDELPEDYNFDEDRLELVDWRERDHHMDCIDFHTYLINYIPDPDYPGMYIEDPEAEYSAYIGETDGFVTQSKYVCKAAMGSPCIPNQVDLNSNGDIWAFTLPPSIWGSDLPEGMEIIKVEGMKIYNLSGILNSR